MFPVVIFAIAAVLALAWTFDHEIEAFVRSVFHRREE